MVELLLVIGLVAVLASIVLALSKSMRNRAEGAACIANMKSIFTALAAFTNDNKHWPQPPESAMADEELFWEFWITVLGEDTEYDVPEKTWVCPTYRRLAGGKDYVERTSTYLPAGFDAVSSSTPYRWGNQPWLMEIGNHHGKGALVLYPDGSVVPLDEKFGKPE